MKKMFLYSIVLSIFFVYCEKENQTDEGPDRKQLKSASGDTLVINFNETINLQDGQSWIKFIDVEESRCPSNAQCVWEGNAKIKLIYFDGASENFIYLNTHGSSHLPSEKVIDDLYFKLSSVNPYPDGSEITKDDYWVKIYVQYLDELDGIISEVKGAVRDYTGLDGCGLVIELDNGKKLEPGIVLPNVQLYDGQEVTLWYEEMDGMASICMVGQIVKIYKVESLSCPSYTTIPIGSTLDEYPSDDIGMDTAYIDGDNLYISIGHSGGCADHSYQLLMFPITCGTPPLPKPVFWLSHNANGDMCEAFLRDTICFNLKQLRNLYDTETDIELRTITGSRSISLKY